MTEKMINALKKFDDLSDPNNTSAKELASEKKIQNAINRELSTMKMADKITAIEEALEFMQENRVIAWANVKTYYREKLSDYLDKQSDEDPITPDRKLNQIITLATDGRKIQKKHKKHAEEFMRSYSEIKKDTPPGISIEGFIEKVGMTEVSTNTYREWIEKFDNAEEMLSNDD